MLFLTIPTAGSRPQLLGDLVATAGVPRENTILVATRPDVVVPEECHVIEDLGPINIQRWWNRGIDEAVRRGATAVAVLNDDVRIAPRGLESMYNALSETGTTIASPSRPEWGPGVHKGRLVPYRPVLWGACWVLDVSSPLRPDERYRWWYGDNDLDIRARRNFRGIVSVDVAFENTNTGESTSLSVPLQELAAVDGTTFWKQYGTLMRITRFIERWSWRKTATRVGG